MLFEPNRIYIDESVTDSQFTQNILAKFPKAEQIFLDPSNKEQPYQDVTLSTGKKHLYLKAYQGAPIKLCPGFSKDVLCCNYYVLDLVENCPLECTYCILQAFLNRPIIVLHVNVEEVIDRLKTLIDHSPEQIFRIGTGEHSDSLAIDHIFKINPYLVKSFAHFNNAYLELKTKTDMIEPLIGLNHGGKTVIGWSLNPPEIIKSQEYKTATLDQRLKAASKMADEGYKIAFHFDPIIYYPDWKSGYRQTIESMFDAVDTKQIAWISLGTLRYIPSLKKIAEQRFPNLSIFSNEFIPAEDGKMRYLKIIRQELIQQMSIWISALSPKTPLYICMEKLSVWNKTMQHIPDSPEELDKYLQSNL